jgi:hypothetical protein
MRTWAQLHNHILKGRSKHTRPLYFKYFSARFVNPDDPANSDITINNRWRHQYSDPVSIKRSRYVKEEDKEQYEETLSFREDINYQEMYRTPVMVLKPDGTTIINSWHLFKGYGDRSLVMWMIGASDIRRSRKTGRIKIRMPYHLPINTKRKKPTCRKCGGEKIFIYTCWESDGPEEEMQHTLHNAYVNFCKPYDLESHMTHIVKANCGWCGGTGRGTHNKPSIDSFDCFDVNHPLVKFDPLTKELTYIPIEGGTTVCMSSTTN